MIMPMMQFPILPSIAPKCMIQSPKHCKMAAPVADNSLSLIQNQSKKRGERCDKKNGIPGNPQCANNNAAKTLKAYLAEIGEDQAFEKFSR